MRWLAILAGCVVVGCGGGGGSSWLTFDPETIDVSFYEGDPTSVNVLATSTKELDGPVYVGIVDMKGVLGGDPYFEQMGMEVAVRLPLNPSLPVGVHTGSLEVRVCKDDPVVCAHPWGGPWSLGYRIEVLRGTNLTPLSALPGAAPWITLGGNARHTGYVPATIDPANFSRRWVRQGVVAGAAAEGGRLFVVAGAYSQGAMHWKLMAISEADGQLAWESDLGELSYLGPPAVAHGHVYVASSGQEDTALWAFDQATGAFLKRLPMSSQWDYFGPPEVHGDAVYSQNGYYGGFSKFDGPTLEEVWFADGAGWYTEPYTALAEGEYVYMHDGNRFRALWASDGEVAFTIDDENPHGLAYDEGEALVLGGGGAVYNVLRGGLDYGQGALLRLGRLQRFDVVGRTASWDHQGWYNSTPAVVGDVLYVVNGPWLQALDAATGDELWSWDIPEGADTSARQQLVVVGRHAFVTSARALYAVDLDTHQQVWRYPAAGRLAVSENGVLYVIGDRVAAINLH